MDLTTTNKGIWESVFYGSFKEVNCRDVTTFCFKNNSARSKIITMTPSLDMEAVFSNTVPGGNGVSHAPILGGLWMVCLSTLQEGRGKALSATRAQSWGCGRGSPWPAAAELTQTLPPSSSCPPFRAPGCTARTAYRILCLSNGIVYKTENLWNPSAFVLFVLFGGTASLYTQPK